VPDFGNLFDFVGGGVIPVLLVVLVLVLVVAYLGSRYKVAGANEALIISGRRERGPAGEQGLKVVRGQGVVCCRSCTSWASCTSRRARSTSRCPTR
jgi:hypothetical protein